MAAAEYVQKEETTRIVSPGGAPVLAQVVTTPAGTPQEFQRKKTIFRAYQVIWYLLGVLEVVLAFRFFLRLLGANPATGFVSFIYALSAPFVAPFRGVFRTPAVEGYVLEWATLLAMLVYAVVAYGIIHLLQLSKPVRPEEVEQGTQRG